MNYDGGMFTGGLASILSGLFGNSGKPYEEAENQYEKWADKTQNINQPYLNAGKTAIPNYQNWLNTMKEPSEFINSLMNNYKESPFIQFLQKKAQNAGINAGSASGLTGSSALTEQMQQNAADIAQQGIDSWLQNVLGINTQYGQGQQNLIGTGQNATNSLTNMYNQMGQRMGETAYGKEAGKQNDLWNTIGGGLGMLTGFGFL